MLELTAAHIAKTFNRRNIFRDVSFTLKEGASLTLTGRNGSGKSTLMKIIAGVLTSSRGSIVLNDDGKTIPSADHYRYFGFVSPYLQLYDEFSGEENIRLVQEIRGLPAEQSTIDGALADVGLAGRGGDLLRTYSSGMKQRLKYAAALVHRPRILLLDEPTSNLDEEGKAFVHRAIERQKGQGILILATNERDELSLCDAVITLGDPAGGKEGL